MDYVFLCMFAAALLFLVLTARDRKNFAWPCLAVLFLMMCMVGVINLESGYSFAYENATDNSVRVATGVHSYDGAAPLAVVFFGLVIIVILYMLGFSFGGGESK